MLHTSDWHLGRSFHGVGLLGAQAAYLDHLVEVVRSERIDALLVSGDVYDRAMPPPDAVKVFSESLVRLVDAGAEVIVSSGNHDSAVRLGFAGGLLERAGVHVRTSVADIGRPVLLGDGDVAVHPLPYLEPALTAGLLGTEERTHAGVLRAAMERVRAALGSARHDVVMAHAFVSGGVGSDSERDISVGGVSAVPPAVFAGCSYAALGHLHGQQQVAEGVRYSGSPVAMSFGEAGHRKSSTLMDLSGAVPVMELIPAPVERPLAVLRGELEALLADPSLESARGSWCQVTLTDDLRPLGAMDRVKARFPHTVELRFEPSSTAATAQPYARRVAERAPLDVCCDFLDHVRAGAPATDDERAVLRAGLDAVRLARAVKDDEGAPAPERSDGGQASVLESAAGAA